MVSLHAPTVEILQSLLRGEIAAIESYELAQSKLKDVKVSDLARQIRHEHQQAARHLEHQIERWRGEFDEGSGIWGTWTRTVTRTARLLGGQALLKALEEGERVGLRQYQDAANHPALDADSRNLVAELIPRQQRHVEVLQAICES